MTIFGILYLIVNIFGGIVAISEIGKPRKPRTAADVTGQLLITGFCFWGLWVWGLH